MSVRWVSCGGMGLGPRGRGLGRWVLSGTPALLSAQPPQHLTLVCPQVTRHQESLFNLWRLEAPDMALEELEFLSSNMTCRLRRLLIEQDSCREVCLQVAQQPGGRWGGAWVWGPSYGRAPHPDFLSSVHTICPPGPFPRGQGMGTFPAGHSPLRHLCEDRG